MGENWRELTDCAAAVQVLRYRRAAAGRVSCLAQERRTVCVAAARPKTAERAQNDIA